MRALGFGRDGVRHVDLPEPTGSGVAVQVEHVGICGTDVASLGAGESAVVPGHEIVGTTPDGRRVAVQPNLACQDCSVCHAGESQRCPQSMARFLGVTLDGGFAETVLVDESLLHPLPGTLDAAHAALAEPAAVARHAVRRLDPPPGEPVLVIGGGTIGLLAAAQLVTEGHAVDLVARHDHQLAAAEAVGATARGAHELAGSSFARILDTGGTQSAADLAYEVGRPGARLVSIGALGWAAAASGVSLVKEIELVPSVIYTRREFERSIDWLAEHPDVPERLVTHRFPLSEAAQAFAVAGSKAAHRSLKVLLSP